MIVSVFLVMSLLVISCLTRHIIDHMMARCQGDSLRSSGMLGL